MSPPDLVHAVRRAAAAHVDATLSNALDPGGMRWEDESLEQEQRLLPLEIEDGTPFRAWVAGWLADPRQPAAVFLTAPIGSGKTIATLLAQRDLQGNCRKERDVDLWVSLSEVKCPNSDPVQAIAKQLKLPDGWDFPARPMRLLVLDGLDEVLAYNNPHSVLEWLGDLLRAVVTTGARLLISSRDVALGWPGTQAKLDELLNTYCGLRSGGPAQYLPLRLRAWNDDALRPALHERLARRFGEERAAELEALVARKVLSSPLLFGLADRVLTDEGKRRTAGAGPARGPGKIDSPFQLTAWWVRCIIDRHLHARGSSADALRRCACFYSFYLVISNLGMSGTTLEKLMHPDLHWVWDMLKPQDDVKVPDGHPEPRFRRRQDEFLRSTLLQQRGERFAPFHEHLLNHLALEALAYFLRGGEDFDSGFGPPPGPDDPFSGGPLPESGQMVAGPVPDPFRVESAFRAVAGPARGPGLLEALGDALGLPGLPRLRHLVNRFGASCLLEPAAPSGLAGRGHFDSLLRDYVRDLPPSAKLPPVTVRHFVTDAAAAGEQPRALGTGLVLHNHLVAQREESRRQLRMVEQREYEKLTAGQQTHLEWQGHELLLLPAGTYPVWQWRIEDSSRTPGRVTLAGPVYLARGPVTVAQYRAFLNDFSSIRPPDHTEVGWRRRGGMATHKPEAADWPVTGVSPEDVRAYCAWLTGLYKGAAGIGLEFLCPRADWLRVATWGTELRPPAPFAEGPFGHESLVGALWQWTAEGRIFGGIPSLSDKPEEGRTACLHAWPDLCADAPGKDRRTVGFRVAALVQANAPEAAGQEERVR